MDALPAGVFPARARLVTAVPHVVSRTLADGVRGGELRFSGALAALAGATAFAERLGVLHGIEWVVYAKRPFAGPEQGLAYLGRYTHRVAIAKSRLIQLADGQVSFAWKDYRHHGNAKVMTLTADEFMRRFLLRRTVRELQPASLASVSCAGSHWPSVPSRFSRASPTH